MFYGHKIISQFLNEDPFLDQMTLNRLLRDIDDLETIIDNDIAALPQRDEKDVLDQRDFAFYYEGDDLVPEDTVPMRDAPRSDQVESDDSEPPFVEERAADGLPDEGGLTNEEHQEIFNIFSEEKPKINLPAFDTEAVRTVLREGVQGVTEKLAVAGEKGAVLRDGAAGLFGRSGRSLKMTAQFVVSMVFFPFRLMGRGLFSTLSFFRKYWLRAVLVAGVMFSGWGLYRINVLELVRGMMAHGPETQESYDPGANIEKEGTLQKVEELSLTKEEPSVESTVVKAHDRAKEVNKDQNDNKTPVMVKETPKEQKTVIIEDTNKVASVKKDAKDKGQEDRTADQIPDTTNDFKKMKADCNQLFAYFRGTDDPAITKMREEYMLLVEEYTMSDAQEKKRIVGRLRTIRKTLYDIKTDTQ